MAHKRELRKHPLRSIYFYLTEGCNLRCRHCWIEPKYQTDGHPYTTLDVDLFKSIIVQAKPMGLSCVKLTGGEPLLHPRIHEILELVRGENLRLVVETNGVLCSQQISLEIAACTKPRVSVSLDGVDADTHEWMRGVNGCFDAAVEGIRNLVGTGLKPQIIMALVRRNREQMEPVVRLAESLGAGSVKFNIVEPIARGERMHEAGEALSIEELVRLGEWVEHSLSTSTRLRLFYSHPIAFCALGRMFGENGNGCGFCRIKSIIGVLANGTYALCGIGETVPDLVFGHAATDSLKDIWDNNHVLIAIREGIPERLEGVCASCLVRHVCLGSCIAQNYYLSGTLWAPFWYCEQAMDKGLFPETRSYRFSRR